MGKLVRKMENGYYENCNYHGVDFLKKCFVKYRKAGSGYYIMEAKNQYRFFHTLEQVKRYIDMYNGYMELRVD